MGTTSPTPSRNSGSSRGALISELASVAFSLLERCRSPRPCRYKVKRPRVATVPDLLMQPSSSPSPRRDSRAPCVPVAARDRELRARRARRRGVTDAQIVERDRVAVPSWGSPAREHVRRENARSDHCSNRSADRPHDRVHAGGDSGLVFLRDRFDDQIRLTTRMRSPTPMPTSGRGDVDLPPRSCDREDDEGGRSGDESTPTTSGTFDPTTFESRPKIGAGDQGGQWSSEPERARPGFTDAPKP